MTSTSRCQCTWVRIHSTLRGRRMIRYYLMWLRRHLIYMPCSKDLQSKSRPLEIYWPLNLQINYRMWIWSKTLPRSSQLEIFREVLTNTQCSISLRSLGIQKCQCGTIIKRMCPILPSSLRYQCPLLCSWRLLRYTHNIPSRITLCRVLQSKRTSEYIYPIYEIYN